MPLASESFMAFSPGSFSSFTFAAGSRKSMAMSPPHSIHLKRYQPNQALRIELVIPSVRGGWLGRGCPVTRRPYVNFIRLTYLPLNSLDHVFPPARTAVGGGTSGAIPESEHPQNGKGSGV